MYSHNFVVGLFFITCLYQSYGISSTENSLKNMEDGFTTNIVLSSSAFEGAISLRGVISANATIAVTVDTRSLKNASFLIFQAHSYVQPLILSSSSALVDGGHVNGTDTGLYANLDSEILTFYIFNTNSEPVSLMLVPVLYGSEDPVPGGCNLSFSVNIAPFMTITYKNNNEIIQVDAQAASSPNQSNCSPSGLFYDVYKLDLNDTNADSYFDGIISVITAKGAHSHGTRTPTPIRKPELRRRFASYAGFGSIYVVTVRDAQTGKSSAYVPIAQYNCIAGNDDDCDTSAGSGIVVLSFLALLFVAVGFGCTGGHPKLMMRSIFILGSALSFEPAVPSPLRWVFVGFLCLPFLCWCILGLRKQVGPLDLFCTLAYPLAPTHILVGIFIYAGLGDSFFKKLPEPFTDAQGTIMIFGLCFLLFCVWGISSERNVIDEFCSISLLVLFISAVTKGSLRFIYVDPSRIVRPEFYDVIFSPPQSLYDRWLFASWPILLIVWLIMRRYLPRHDSSYFELK